MPLYHYQIGLPKVDLKPVFGLVGSAHAREEAARDYYGALTLPDKFLPRTDKVIEIETDAAGEVVKILARKYLDARDDVVFAFLV